MWCIDSCITLPSIKAFHLALIYIWFSRRTFLCWGLLLLFFCCSIMNPDSGYTCTKSLESLLVIKKFGDGCPLYIKPQPSTIFLFLPSCYLSIFYCYLEISHLALEAFGKIYIARQIDMYKYSLYYTFIFNRLYYLIVLPYFRWKKNSVTSAFWKDF